MTKILIVEDSKTYNNTLFALLRKPDIQIYQAYCIKEAMDILQEHIDINYVLLDLILPDGEGDDLVMEIFAPMKNPPKIIVLSGNQDIQRRNYLFENGVIDFFSKDIPLKLLARDIHKLINTLEKNKNKNILVVDDSTFVLRSIKNILESKNYNVYTAKDPTLAFDILDSPHSQRIDLIFTDLEMPKMNGIEFLEKIKSQEKYINTPVLILSSSTNRENYARVLKHGAIDYIKKPFLTEEILLKADLHISQADYAIENSKQAKELQEYKRVLNESDIVSVTDRRGIIKEVNDKFCEISGYSSDFIIGKSHNILRHPDMPKKVFKDMWNKIYNHETFKGIIKNRRRDGTTYYVDATISPILDVNGDISEVIGIRHDITDVMNPKKQLMADISYLDDPLLIFLQISNYDLFKEFYSESVMHTFEFEVEQVILNYFPSYINIQKVYNLGNGLFGFLKSDIVEEKTLQKAFKYVLKTFKKLGISFQENHYDVDICLSYSNQGNHILDDVYLGIQHAVDHKLSIVNAKNFYRRAQIEARNKLKNLGMIKDALGSNGDFVSYFQPIIDNATGDIIKYESLIRLVDQNGKILSPFHFLDIAKKTGYYNNITQIVIKNCEKALRYTDKKIAINLSGSDIENEDTRNALLKLITTPEYMGRITYELLEDEELKDFDLVKDFIIESKLKGKVQIAIDDFGSGYSNYERLLEFQPDILKIDGSLIKNIVTDPYSLNVVNSIIHFAKNQNIKTVAEFVSDEEILAKIKEIGIDYSQGFFLGEPVKLFD